MSRYTSISALADEVLATVVEEARVKTAQATAPVAPIEAYRVPMARDLRKLAEELREGDEDEQVMPEDLAALGNDAEVEQLLMALQENPELLAALMAEERLDVPDDLALDAPPPVPPDAGPPVDDEEPMVPKAAHDLRKLASYLRQSVEHQRQRKLVKAASMLNAAMGIQHLVGGTK